MQYETLYREFKKRIPESVPFLEERERTFDINELDGQHVLFGIAVEHYVLDRLVKNDVKTIDKIASFIEAAEETGDATVAEVIEQSIIEHLVSADRNLVAKYDALWGDKTKEAFRTVGQWFIN